MKRLTTIAVSALVVAACNGFGVGVQGSGNVITESREVSGFNEIELGGNATVLVDVTGTESVEIEAENNIIPLLETEVRNGRLHLGARSSITPTVEVIYRITAAALDGVEISGSGSVTATGVDADDFSVDLSGSGDLDASGVVANRLSVSISGSGSFHGEELVAPEGLVEVSGSGNTVVNVTDRLVAAVSGSGDIEYLGTPSTETDISGSGSISPLEAGS